MPRSDRVDLSDPAQVDRYLSERVVAEGDCWVWTGVRNNHGYGRLQLSASNDYVHRFSYEYHRADIPEGLHLDHLCRNPPCVNPWHLEPVTQRENNRRAQATKSKCPQGHPYAGDNLNIRHGKRYCRACHATRERLRRKRLKEMSMTHQKMQVR